MTGAGRGIGHATALALARAGLDVAVNDLDASSAETAAQTVRELGRRSLSLPGDVSSPVEVRSLVQRLTESWGGVDVLINNAGIVHSGNLQDTLDEDWERVMGVNLRGTFLVARGLVPLMIERRWGRVVNLASMAARMGRGFVGSACYGASKGAVVSFTRGLARELAPHGITVNAVAPGVIDTDMNHHYLVQHAEDVLRTIPLGRFGAPNDIAATVAFLASDDAGYITGAIVDVNGGIVFG